MTRTAITCREGVRILMDYTEGLVPRRRRQAVEAHVAGCARCRGFVRSYLETPRILRDATLTPMPSRLGHRLRQRVKALATARGRHARR